MSKKFLQPFEWYPWRYRSYANATVSRFIWSTNYTQSMREGFVLPFPILLNPKRHSFLTPSFQIILKLADKQHRKKYCSFVFSLYYSITFLVRRRSQRKVMTMMSLLWRIWRKFKKPYMQCLGSYKATRFWEATKLGWTLSLFRTSVQIAIFLL